MKKPAEQYERLEENALGGQNAFAQRQANNQDDQWLNRNLESTSEAGGYKSCRQCCGNIMVFSQVVCASCGYGNTKLINEGQIGLKV